MNLKDYKLEKKWMLRFFLALAFTVVVTSFVGAYVSWHINETLMHKKPEIKNGSMILVENNVTEYGKRVNDLREYGDIAVYAFILFTSIPLLAPFYIIEVLAIYWIIYYEQKRSNKH